MPFLNPEDLAPFADIEEPKALQMIEDAESMAALAAPCITNPEFSGRADLVAALKAILRRSILRWEQQGFGALQQVGAGPFQLSTNNTAPKTLFWPSEIEQLQNLCRAFQGEDEPGVLAVDRAAMSFSPHLPWCARNFGANYCSCGAELAGRPIYENKPGL